jgi:hypothetical protein
VGAFNSNRVQPDASHSLRLPDGMMIISNRPRLRAAKAAWFSSGCARDSCVASAGDRCEGGGEGASTCANARGDESKAMVSATAWFTTASVTDRTNQLQNSGLL